MALFPKSFLLFKLETIASQALLFSLFCHCPGWVTAVSAEPIPTQQTAQTQAQQMPMIGVVQSAENQTHWQDITTRLAATGLPYRVIDWNTVQRSNNFGDVSVLFLPNVETITSEQLLGLQSWLNRGGRIIVSGTVGSQSSSGVQQALRSLLGAYWASDLSQAQSLQPLRIASQPWVRQADTASTLVGGVIVPTSLSSQPVVVWSQTGDSESVASSDGAAVVVTHRSTFLGWRWGDPASSLPDLDSSWLQAAVSRFQDTPPMQSASGSAPGAATSNPAVSPAGERQRQNQPSQLAQPPSRPMPAITSRTAPSTRTTTQSNAALPNRTQAVVPLTTSQDPAEQTAPAELDVERSFRITLYEATSMQQELENLIGRYESALILSSSRADERVAEAAQTTKTGGTDNSSGETIPVGSAVTTEVTSIDDAVLSQARQGYTTFSQALRQQDYTTARQQWLATRQLLWDNFPLDQPLSQPEVRAIWLDRGTIVRAGSRQGLARIFDSLADAGINTVFFETVNAGYPIYPSRVAPAQNPLTRRWDPLAEAVDLAHQRGIELHAWVWTFAAGNQVHNALLNQPASYPGPVLAAHPDWANYDSRGQLIPPGQTKPFLDPANPEVRSYLLNLFEEIVTRYKVDGLHLDYIRYPFQDPRIGGHTYGYGMAARQQFHQLTGIDPITLSPGATRTSAVGRPQQPQWQQWTDFRTEQINSFVADASRLVHRLNPDLVLSTAVFALPERRRVNEIQQNWEVWAQRGDVDMIVLMSYASDTSGLQRLANPWLSGHADLESTLILPGIRLLNLSDQTVIDQIQALRDSSSGGFALFAAENLNSHLQTIFNQTQSEASIQSTEPIPYRQPFHTAASRYAVLLRQWNWLLENGQLQLREQQLENWQTKAAALDQALQTLANDPSSENLQQAKAQLSSFQNQFKAWINLPTLSEDYRVRTWQNQLSTIETLLEYGERVVLTRQNTTRQAGTP